MPLDSIIEVNISLSQPPIGLLDFGVPLIATTLSSPQATAFGVQRTRELTPSTWRSQMAAVGVVAADDPYRMADAVFGQEVKPRRAIWGRRATAVAQVSRVDVTSTADGAKVVTINGVTHSFPASGSTALQIRDGLIALINGGSQAALVTAALFDADSLDITSDVPGLAFTVSVGTGLASSTVTPNTGIGEDITAIRAENDQWYMLLENLRSDAAILEAAAAIEGLPKMFLGQTLDPLAQSTDALTDVMSRLTALGYVRTALVWNDDIDEMVAEALAGRVLPTKPGSNSWANQVLAGVSGFIPTSEPRLRAKRYTWLESFVAANFSMSQGARTAAGYPIDLILGRDWLRNLIQVREAELLRNSPKVPYTRDGAYAAADVLRGALLEAAAAPYNFIDVDTIEIEVPAPSSQSPTDRGNRHFPGVVWQATAQGAIETMEITGTITA